MCLIQRELAQLKLKGEYLMYNAWCFKCNRIVKVDTEEKPKCPHCGSDVEIKGKVVRIITSNGKYASHI